jgi:Spy/CpxP family protein refolding chaperone
MHKTWIVIAAAVTMSGAAMAADQPDASHPGWNRAAMQEMRAKREARRADDVALLLGLRPDQRPAFDQFLQSMKPPHGGPGDERGPGRPKPSSEDMTTATRLDSMDASADRRNTMSKQKIAATRAFYTSLTPEQQRRFDALDRLRRDHRHGHRGGMRGFRRG